LHASGKLSTLFLLTFAFFVDSAGKQAYNGTMARAYTVRNLIDMLEKRIEGASLRSVSKELGVSAAYLSDVLHGRRQIGPKLARALGFRRRVAKTTIVTFERI
jgi:lambda repressor-like predicted transcriptional regulator